MAIYVPWTYWCLNYTRAEFTKPLHKFKVTFFSFNSATIKISLFFSYIFLCNIVQCIAVWNKVNKPSPSSAKNPVQCKVSLSKSVIYYHKVLDLHPMITTVYSSNKKNINDNKNYCSTHQSQHKLTTPRKIIQ